MVINEPIRSRRIRKGEIIKMSQVVEITIDLMNPNCKPRIETFGIVKTGERNIYCRSGDVGRRFFIPNMNEVKYRGFLQYSYRYQTDKTDYREIVESEKNIGSSK